jgi:hypothetical protein
MKTKGILNRRGTQRRSHPPKKKKKTTPKTPKKQKPKGPPTPKKKKPNQTKKKGGRDKFFLEKRDFLVVVGAHQ